MVETRTNSQIVREMRLEFLSLETHGELVPIGEEIQPSAPPRSFAQRHMLALILLVAPLLIAATYLFFIASDRFASEAHFIVRSAGSSGYEGVSSMIENQGMSRASDETFAVNEFINSRDALEQLLLQTNLTKILSRPEGDFINRFPNFYTKDNKEQLYKRYKQMVNVYIDGATGISTIEVSAFRPDDAHTLTAALLAYAEALINRLNERAHKDALEYADKLVIEARRDLSKVEDRLTAYRNQSSMVDPARESAAAADSINRVSTELAQLETALAQQKAVTPSSPSIRSMQEKIKSYYDEIARQRKHLAGEGNTMASTLSGYEQLVIDREMAGKALASAELNRIRARQELEQQHLYLQTVVEPNTPDQAKYPRRILYFAATAGLCLLAYVIVRSIFDIAAEHVP